MSSITLIRSSSGPDPDHPGHILVTTVVRVPLHEEKEVHEQNSIGRPGPEHMLRSLMRKLSMVHFSVPWLEDLEYHLWAAVCEEQGHKGVLVRDYPKTDLNDLVWLSQASAGWWVWEGELRSGRARLIPQHEWLRMYADWTSRFQEGEDGE